MDSLNLILGWGGVELSDEEKAAWAIKKNDNYLDLISEMNPSEIMPGVSEFLAHIKSLGMRIALGSASKNAVTILNQVGLIDYFEAIIDGTKTTKGKPDPQVFQMGAEALGVQPAEAIVFEDAEKGVQAALNGGFPVIGIGEEATLGHANFVMKSFEGVTLKGLIEQLD